MMTPNEIIDIAQTIMILGLLIVLNRHDEQIKTNSKKTDETT
jgi:hypothetical protein